MQVVDEVILPHPRKVRVGDCEPIADQIIERAHSYNQPLAVFVFPDGRVRIVFPFGKVFEHLSLFHAGSMVGVYDRRAKPCDIARDLTDLHSARL